MNKVTYKKDSKLLEAQFESAFDASEFMAEHDVTKFESTKISNVVAKLATSEAIRESVSDNVLQHYAEESIIETKTYDKPHGKKLPHKILSQFFEKDAPKYDSLAAVEVALAALYKKNGIEFVTQGIKQVVSNYKKHVKVAESVQDTIKANLLEIKST